MRRLCIVALLAFVLGATAEPKHLLFVVVDDLGFDDVGFRSHQIKTPHVDMMAAGGVVLDQYYVQDVCSPSRATFLTGRYAMHNSIVDWIPPADAYGLPLNETTMGDHFQRAGFKTHAIGKWHLGFYKWAFTPTFRGFNSFLGFYSGGEDYFKHTSGGFYDMRRDSSAKCGAGCSQVAADLDGVYSTEAFAAEAVRVVQAHDPSDRLFMYLAFQAVHAPAQVPAKYENMYTDLIPDKKRRVFAGMLTCMDEGLGNVTSALKSKGMWEDTLVVFTTDNGGPTTTGDGVGARNWPLRGGKHSIWEGGVRGTALVYGAGLKKTGYEFTHLMHGADWLPTLTSALGVDMHLDLPLDGVNQWDGINSGNSAVPARTELVLGNSTNYCSWKDGEGAPCGFGIRSGNWKYIHGYGGDPDTFCNSSYHGKSCANHSSSTSFAPGVCTTKAGVCFPGHDITYGPAANASACCDACRGTVNCTGWTLNDGTCYIKSSLENGHVGSCVSGTAGPQPVPPVPSDLVCPPGFCLFDLSKDPHENSVAYNPAMAKQLAARVNDILTSYTEYKIDKACPAVVHPQDPKVGEVWAPWCG